MLYRQVKDHNRNMLFGNNCNHGRSFSFFLFPSFIIIFFFGKESVCLSLSFNENIESKLKIGDED